MFFSLALPFIVAYVSVAVFAVCAFTYRVRGGYDPYPINGTQHARAWWCLPTALIMTLLLPIVPYTLDYHTAVMLGAQFVYIAAALFLALMIPHTYGMFFPFVKDQKLLRAAYMTFVGVARTAIAFSYIPVFTGFTLDNLALVGVVSLFGAMHTVSYWIGAKIPVHREWNNQHYIVDAPTAWAELLWGGAQGSIIFGMWIHKYGII